MGVCNSQAKSGVGVFSEKPSVCVTYRFSKKGGWALTRTWVFTQGDAGVSQTSIYTSKGKQLTEEVEASSPLS